MKTQVEEFMANLLIAGFKREQVSERGYEYALRLQTDQQVATATYVPASFMAIAAETVKSALPGAYRIYEMHNRMH